MACTIITILTNCVSTQHHNTVLRERQRLSEMVSKLRKENDQILLERLNAEGSSRGRGEAIQQVETRFKNQVSDLEAQIERLKADNARLTEENNRQVYENQRMKKESFDAQQNNTKEIELLREKLNWTYRTYNIQRAKRP